MHTLIFGCGYLGQRIAARLINSGESVSAVTRTEDRAAMLRDAGLNAIVADIMEPGSLVGLPGIDRVLYCVGFDRSGGRSKRETYVDGLSNVLAAVSPRTSLTYVSSTSVYGQADGAWVDEHSTTEPASEGGKICLEAEQLLVDRDASIVRLAGIYGPGRVLRRINAVRNREPIAGNPSSWLNLIHVDDAASLVHRILDLPRRQPIYLGCDGHPATRRQFYTELAAVLGAAEPEFDPTLPTRHGSGGVNKRCRSVLLGKMPFDFQYPDFKAGLTAAVQASVEPTSRE